MIDFWWTKFWYNVSYFWKNAFNISLDPILDSYTSLFTYPVTWNHSDVVHTYVQKYVTYTSFNMLDGCSGVARQPNPFWCPEQRSRLPILGWNCTHVYVYSSTVWIGVGELLDFDTRTHEYSSLDWTHLGRRKINAVLSLSHYTLW